MKNTKKNAMAKVAEINAAMDAIEQEIHKHAEQQNWLEFCMGPEGEKLFAKRQRLTAEWLHWYPKTFKRAELVKKLRPFGI